MSISSRVCAVAATASSFTRILETLHDHRVRFILLGGVAAVIEGAPVSTFDLDVVHDRAADNGSRLSRALREMQAYYHAHPGSRLEPTAAELVGEGHHLFPR